jgi:hypothetical protein
MVCDHDFLTGFARAPLRIVNLFVVWSVDFAADWLQSDVGYFTKRDIRTEMRLGMDAPLQSEPLAPALFSVSARVDLSDQIMDSYQAATRRCMIIKTVKLDTYLFWIPTAFPV